MGKKELSIYRILLANWFVIVQFFGFLSEPVDLSYLWPYRMW